MSNALVNITLGGASYGMRPDYGSYRDIEARSDMTIVELLECAMHERLKIDEAVVIVWCGCSAAGEDFDLETVGARLFELRLTNVQLRASICKFLLSLLYSPDDARKKFDAEVAPLLGLTVTG
jgi:hypothetical protein